MTGHQVSTPRLNFDIFAGILAHVERKKDVSSLMKTCKTLYRPAIPHILRDGVTIEGIPKTRSFCQFMLAKHWSKDRNRYLSRLSIDVEFRKNIGYLPFALAETIKGAINLEELQMESLDSLLDGGGKSVFEVLQDLGSHCKLKKLTLQNVGERTVRLLGSMKTSTITDLSLSYDIDIEHPNPFLALRSLRSTITTLHLEYIKSTSLNVQCPLVHTLSLETYPTAVTSALVFAFPNLRRFSVFNESGNHDEDTIDDLRFTNQIDLVQLHGSWTHLRYLSGDVNQLYILGLSCPVYELRVSICEDPDIPRVLDLFDDVSPQMVDFNVSLYHLTIKKVEEFLPAAIQVISDSCSHLRLSIRVGYNEISDCQGFIVSIPTPSSTTALTGFSLLLTSRGSSQFLAESQFVSWKSNSTMTRVFPAS